MIWVEYVDDGGGESFKREYISPLEAGIDLERELGVDCTLEDGTPVRALVYRGGDEAAYDLSNGRLYVGLRPTERSENAD